MARRNLLAEAQVQAAAEVAPQVAALNEALAQARADRNSAIRAASTVYAGVSGTIHRAGPQVRQVYSGAKKQAQGDDALAQGILSKLPSSGGVDTIRAAYAHEGAVGGTVIAKALASRLADLSDRRIAARAGQAFATNKAQADYSAAAATNASKRSALAQQQGLLTGSAFSKLTEAAAGRRNQRLMQQESENFQASQSQADHAFTAHQNALGRRSDRINTGISARGDASKLEQQQQFTASQNAKDRQLRRDLAKQSGSAATKAPTGASIKGRNDIQALVDQYKRSGDYSSVAKKAKKAGFHDSIIFAASNLASKGYIAPREVRDLAAVGIDLPKEWTGVTVRPHVRRRRSK